MAVPDKDIFASTWGPTTGFCVEVIPISTQRQVPSHLPRPRDTSCVAFIEVGGNRNFGHSGQFPISLMSFDGVIFVYDRQNANSAVGLSDWYADLKKYGIVGNGGGAKVMLLETTLAPTTNSTLSVANRLPDELLGAYLQKTVSKPSRWKRLLQKLKSVGARWASKPRLSVTDFQERQRSLRLRIAVFLFHCASRVEGALLFIMAVVLFGPSQESVSLRRPSVEEALALIGGDVRGTQTLEACPLYDQLQFEALAVKDVTSFIDSLRDD
ncbi:putative heat shock protein HslVU, ATPase subunit HslU [Trypanosoma grayi]|uniref:putative heat shock protein HslVU, ATPase subunit HslU n=1 Tax=Trypanosoma grayi TaxID=71804 RepID=UPI0004F4B3D8|nr:putative heat shock protein HslVU, ATPase subunit HslU [Trypanosoma grayi]KEG12826.1 putative heat shock protein HslVU, ATPase subunit HslU [Trypanosoma grayi]